MSVVVVVHCIITSLQNQPDMTYMVYGIKNQHSVKCVQIILKSCMILTTVGQL